MGLLDWLSDAIGSSNGSGGNMLSEGMPMGNPTSGIQAPQPTGPMPPMQQTGPDQPQIGPMPPMPPQGGGIGSDAARVPNQPPIPAPAPQAPPMAPPGVMAPSQSAVPPVPIVPPGGGALPPNAGSTEGVTPPSSGPGPQAQGFLGRALGMDPNSEARLRGTLGAGLTAAGNSAGKSPFQALASGAGAGITGGKAADDKTTADQQKYLTQAIAAMKAGDSREADKALTQLRMAQTQMTLQGKMGKDSVMNSDAQLYLRAVGAANADGPLKLLKKAYDDAVAGRGASSPDAQAAKKAYDDAYQSTLDGHLGRLGLDPKTADKIGKQPGMSQDNPVPKTKMTSQADFDKLQPGMFFVNPKDGQVLMKPMKGIGAAAAALGPDGQQPSAAPAPGGQTLPAGQGGVPAQPASSLPPMPPTTPQASSIPGLGADEDADEKEPA